ncbi:hypothetical protein M066_3579 [Bacteroides fragilis str. I1345]|uniref:ribosomal maturation YjgA family protein n=1 Tax=Bacteroides fragilis TaxID=817 RepID=UPI00044E4004|nr:DUF2809 domain-containing protein [Bacteroides fragilis]EYB17527.1 hypothetical protein M066_3579 [Bacteroides fragilis str. I1345]
MNKSFFYAICFVVILVVEIIIGIYVRDNFVRPYMGDALVVVLIYCFIRIFIPNGLSQLPLYVLAFACFIEILQYFQLVDVLGISNRILRIALGSTFDLKDMVSYAGGYKGDKTKCDKLSYSA